jgi:membrane protease YdiL (CAAX protease family)
MLFLLKRTCPAALAGLAVLAVLGLALRPLVPSPVLVDFSGVALLQGLSVFWLVLVSDGLIHGALLLFWGAGYRARHRELVDLYEGQTFAAVMAGALMAGVGEELFFRGLSAGPVLLGVSAVAFGLLHHVRRRLTVFTVWAAWQGVLLGAALVWSGNLAVTMVAHFLHDATGFVIFRRLRGGR